MIGKAKWVLGTANFGNKYGFASNKKSLQALEISNVLDKATDAGFYGIDTARVYGDSENIIGELNNKVQGLRIMTKINPTPNSSTDEILQEIHASIEKLGRFPNVVYFHSKRNLLELSNQVMADLAELVHEAKVPFVFGSSVYEINEILEVREVHPWINVFQVPLNILSPESDIISLKNLQSHNLIIFIRSIFLQGILLSKPGNQKIVNALNGEERRILEDFHRKCSIQRISPLQACINFAAFDSSAFGCVLGVSSYANLVEIVNAIEQSEPINLASWPKSKKGMFDLRQQRFH
jgi:aryl-alcohol dehydrogenase-like predicted oxidoreductase